MQKIFLSIVASILVATNICAEDRMFFLKLSPSMIQFHDLSVEDDSATKYLQNYTKSRFFYSANIGLGAFINDKISIGIDISYFPHGYANLYNKSDISALTDFSLLSDKKLQPIKDAQNFVLTDAYSILFALNYHFPSWRYVTPFIGAKIGYVSGKIGMDPAFYDIQEQVASENQLTLTRNKNSEKLAIEMIKFAPLALGGEIGCSFRFKENILFDIIYEVAKFRFENIIDRVIENTPSKTLQSYGIKDHILIHKISAGFRFLL
jgi:hypothetical protein